MSELIHAERYGSGLPIVLVHGSASDATVWVAQIAHLAKHYRLLAVHRRGTPASPLPPEVQSWSVTDHARDLQTLLDAEGIKSAIFCGSSLGGVVSLELARIAPERVQGLVLIEPPIPIVEEEDADLISSQLADRFEQVAHSEGLRAASMMFLRSVLGEEAFAQLKPVWRERSLAMGQAIRMDIQAIKSYRGTIERFRSVQSPTLLISGERSLPIYQTLLNRLVTVMPQAEHHRFPRAGHMVQAETPKAFHRRLFTFADRVFDLD